MAYAALTQTIPARPSPLRYSSSSLSTDTDALDLTSVSSPPPPYQHALDNKRPTSAAAQTELEHQQHQQPFYYFCGHLHLEFGMDVRRCGRWLFAFLFGCVLAVVGLVVSIAALILALLVPSLRTKLPPAASLKPSKSHSEPARRRRPHSIGVAPRVQAPKPPTTFVARRSRHSAPAGPISDAPSQLPPIVTHYSTPPHHNRRVTFKLSKTSLTSSNPSPVESESPATHPSPFTSPNASPAFTPSSFPESKSSKWHHSASEEDSDSCSSRYSNALELLGSEGGGDLTSITSMSATTFSSPEVGPNALPAQGQHFNVSYHPSVFSVVNNRASTIDSFTSGSSTTSGTSSFPLSSIIESETETSKPPPQKGKSSFRLFRRNSTSTTATVDSSSSTTTTSVLSRSVGSKPKRTFSLLSSSSSKEKDKTQQKQKQKPKPLRTTYTYLFYDPELERGRGSSPHYSEPETERRSPSTPTTPSSSATNTDNTITPTSAPSLSPSSRKQAHVGLGLGHPSSSPSARRRAISDSSQLTRETADSPTRRSFSTSTTSTTSTITPANFLNRASTSTSADLDFDPKRRRSSMGMADDSESSEMRSASLNRSTRDRRNRYSSPAGMMTGGEIVGVIVNTGRHASGGGKS